MFLWQITSGNIRVPKRAATPSITSHEAIDGKKKERAGERGGYERVSTGSGGGGGGGGAEGGGRRRGRRETNLNKTQCKCLFYVCSQLQYAFSLLFFFFFFFFVEFHLRRSCIFSTLAKQTEDKNVMLLRRRRK